MGKITVIGGGLAGLVAAIETAEAGANVELLEAHRMLGGRARSSRGDYVANLGPHVVYDNGAIWPWLAERGLVAGVGRVPRRPSLVFRFRGERRRVPPAAALRALRILRRPDAPVDQDLRHWVDSHAGPEVAEVAARLCGVFTFDADPGRLSAAFVTERARQVFTVRPAARYFPGGWQTLTDRLVAAAQERGVVVRTGAHVDSLPTGGPVIVATDLAAARRILEDPTLVAEGTRTALIDVGLRRPGRRRRNPFIVSDLDEGGWVETFSRADATLAPAGHDLVQAQLGLRADESLDEGVARLERLLDAGLGATWRAREVWRRRSVVENSSGALDLPGRTWRDRPAVDRGDGVFLAGDMVAAPGLLSDVSYNSAVEAARLAVQALAGRGGGSGRASGAVSGGSARLSARPRTPSPARTSAG